MMSLWRQSDEKPISNKYVYWALLPIFALIFLYFHRWQPTSIFGDDLYIYDLYTTISDFEITTMFQKYRPVNNAIIHALIGLFGKNITGYYYFNVFIQAVNTALFIRIINLFSRSFLFACIAGLMVGLSRFDYYNLTQLYIGGGLEGIAMTFFLGSVFYALKAFLNSTDKPRKSVKAFFWCMFYANLSMYSHERYIVIFPFITLCVLMPNFKTVAIKTRIEIITFAVLSIVINYCIKRYIFHISFFMGTSNSNITFSYHSALGYLKDGVLSIMQVNSEPEYLTGKPFSALDRSHKIVSILSTALPVFLFIYYHYRLLKKTAKGEVNEQPILSILFVLYALFVLCMVPAVSTIRLEQRWLQASQSIYILVISIMILSLPVKDAIKMGVFVVFSFLFVKSDAYYLYTGVSNVFMYTGNKKATMFKQALENGTIYNSTDTIYIYERTKNINDENEISWITGGGSLFKFYTGRKKNIQFIDSVDNQQVRTKLPMQRDKKQVIYFDEKIIDITDKFTANTFTIPKHN